MDSGQAPIGGRSLGSKANAKVTSKGEVAEYETTKTTVNNYSENIATSYILSV